MQPSFNSILLLTILLAIVLVFFLRAASKDRTTVVDVQSPLPPIEVLNGISLWLIQRGWESAGGDADRKVLRFHGNVSSSAFLTVFLSMLGGLGSACLGLVLKQLIPGLGWWPLLLSLVGAPVAGILYRRRASRDESLELRLISSEETKGSILRLRAHRDELIAMEIELSKSLELRSDGALLSSPI